MKLSDSQGKAIQDALAALRRVQADQREKVLLQKAIDALEAVLQRDEVRELVAPF